MREQTRKDCLENCAGEAPHKNLIQIIFQTTCRATPVQFGYSQMRDAIRSPSWPRWVERLMSAIGTKRTSRRAQSMSAFGG